MIVALDFETHAVRARPDHPPKPVGVAIHAPNAEPVYMAWGHPRANNCSWHEAHDALRALWDDPGVHLLFHHAAFDVAVAVERMRLPMLPWQRIHDTAFLLFLYDPHARKLDLKSAAEKILSWPAEERDELHEWIYERRAEILSQHGQPGDKITRAKSGDNSPAAWIAYAPGNIVGKYAIGDVRRTRALFYHLYSLIRAQGMGSAYDRERRLLPLLMENERIGLRVDEEGLRSDVALYTAALSRVETQMRYYLNAPDLNFDADRDVAAAFQACGAVKEDAWVLTEKSGQLSVSKDNLPPEAFTDPLLASAFGYRNRLVTCLKMFLFPWLEQAAATGGRVHSQWNQVKGSRGGTRTGRPSMTKPNLLNVSKSFEDRSDGYEHPAALELPPLPLARRYVLPDEGELFLHRDFSGQEMRIFAHFEAGDLAAAYRDNPRLDPHDWIRAEILRTTGRELERTRVKNVSFARLYGGGAGAVMQQARCKSRAEAQEIMAFHDRALPGRQLLSGEIQRCIRRGEPIRTWGGRLYYVEPPKMIDGRRQTFEYKLINYLIQGSAADVTKEVLCRWYDGGGPSLGARFLLTVYDEINLSTARVNAQESMEYLRGLMDGVELDVPMRSDGKIGERWGELEKVSE